MRNNHSYGKPQSGKEEAIMTQGRRQGKDYNQPRQEHTNNGIAVREDQGSDYTNCLHNLPIYNYFICMGAYWITYWGLYAY